ncbi:GNAT family N-acetyltransferase [Streptomyces sp. NPDC059003]|uniref:GNAT family N-acetyltransferase n=1 Tax=Streptomyces sp. NPDC059003 TaxID=3346691 RepID=UPI0036C01111
MNAKPGIIIRIRPGRPEDADAVMSLVSLINLRQPSENLPEIFEGIRIGLALDPAPPLTHGFHLCLIAELADGTPVGTILGGPARWFNNHNFMVNKLVKRIGCIQDLAVRAEHQRNGIGSALMRHAEQMFRQGSYTVLTLRHEPGLEHYYGPLGYTSAKRLVIDLPWRGRTTVARQRGWIYGIKPLAPGVKLTSDPAVSVPVITGALS